MKFLTSLFTVSAKLMLLGCFVLMNGNCGVAEAKVSPCHARKEVSQEKNHQHKGDCGQCKFSQRNWSTPATLQAIPSEKLLPVWQNPILFLGAEQFPEILEEIAPSHGPPDELFSRTFSRIFRSTRWKSSGR